MLRGILFHTLLGALLGTCISVCLFASQALAITDYTGWWWEGEEKSGTGVSIEDQGDRIYMAWYGYDDSGLPVWYSALIDLSDGVFSGELYRYTGWPLEQNRPEDGYQAEDLGPLSIEFYNSETAMLRYTIGGTEYAKSLSRYWPGEPDLRLLHGWWYDPDYDGMGLFLESRDEQLFASWYHYRQDKSPRWWITIDKFPFRSTRYGNKQFWEYAGGQTLTGEFQSPEGADTGKNLSIEFFNESRATMTWQGRTYNLQRFVFGRQAKPRYLRTGYKDYPDMLTHEQAALVAGEYFDQAGFYSDQGHGFWFKREGEGAGAMLYAYRDDYLAIAKVISSTEANLALVEPSGQYAIYLGLDLDPAYAAREDRDSIAGKEASLISLGRDIGLLSSLVAEASGSGPSSSSFRAMALACDSALLVELAKAESEEDFEQAGTVLDVAACDLEDTQGVSCGYMLAYTIQNYYSNAYDDFASDQAAAIGTAVSGIGGKQSCMQSVSIPSDITENWTDECYSVNEPGNYAKYYTFTLSSTTPVLIVLDCKILYPRLYLLQGGDSTGDVIASYPSYVYTHPLTIFETLTTGTYTIETTSTIAGNDGELYLSLRTSNTIWDIEYDWGCTGGDDIPSAYFLFHNDGTFDTTHGNSGTWTQVGSTLTFTYPNGTVYTGTVLGNYASGTMIGGTSGDTGCWHGTLLTGRSDRPTRESAFADRDSSGELIE